MSTSDQRVLSRPRLGYAALALEKRFILTIALVLSLFVAAMLIAIVWMCDGHFIYSLDDPYISLSLGWHIGHGEYGVTAGEASSPSSSILFPILLGGFAWASWQQFVPLVVNTCAAICTGALIGATAYRYGIIDNESQIPRATFFVVFVCLAINTVGLVFDGLEHSLHALTSLFVVVMLARAFEENRVRAPLIVAIVLLPLWRFEGIALAALAILGLAVTGYWRASLLAFAGVAVGLVAYMLVMHGLGLPLLPSSVLSKSAIARTALDSPVGLWASIVHNATAGFQEWEARPVLLLIALIVARPIFRLFRPSVSELPSWSWQREAVFAAVVAGTLTAHVLFGAWGWFARYEDYALACGVGGAIVLWKRPIRWFMARKSPIYDGLAFATIGFLGILYLSTTVATPFAAQGIYYQQYQMHRFLVDYYRQPVAVNDLGWVSYGNPYYVLDLWGLGSEEARQMRLVRHDPDWMGRLVDARHIGMAIVLDEWFAGQIPAKWHRLAVLQTPKRPTLALTLVSFYATSEEAVTPALDALRAFKRQLISATSLTIFDDVPSSQD